jgi:RNA polymerase sigma-70 factor (ECF subfamily)
MNSTEIESVVGRVLCGEIEAFEQIVRRYQQEVWRVVAAMLLNAQKTEDLVQQSFIKAYQNLHRYQPGRDFGAWLKEIARNEVRQEIRRFTREDRRLELYHAHLVQMYDNPSGSAQQAALEETLVHCTDKLPPASVRLLDLRYQASLNFAEIAASAGRTIDATRQQLARIRDSLRECIEKHLVKI